MKIFPKIIFILFILSCGSSDDITGGLIEIKTLQAQKKWVYTVPITENSDFESDLSYNLKDDPDLSPIVAVWLPNIIFGLLSIFLVYNAKR